MCVEEERPDLKGLRPSPEWRSRDLGRAGRAQERSDEHGLGWGNTFWILVDAAARAHRSDDEHVLEYFVPFSFFAFILPAAWVVWAPGEGITLVIGLAMFALWMAVLGCFVSRVWYNVKTVTTHHLNPYI